MPGGRGRYHPARIAFMACRARASLGAEGLDGVDGGGAARGQIAREERGGDEAEGGGAIGDWIDRAHFK